MPLARNASSIEERSSIEISGPDGDKKPNVTFAVNHRLQVADAVARSFAFVGQWRIP